MTTLPNLHDGFFDGVWLSADKRARFFVRTVSGERSTIILSDVEALNICGLRAGNIIFDLVLIAPDKLTAKNIALAYDLKSGALEIGRQGCCPVVRTDETGGVFVPRARHCIGPEALDRLDEDAGCGRLCSELSLRSMGCAGSS